MHNVYINNILYIINTPTYFSAFAYAATKQKNFHVL
jgi:hypothetical protein